MLNKSELTIYLTNKCNLSCSHCYRPDGNTELSSDNIFWILDNIKNKRTTFLGGEPLLYPYLKDCIEAFPQVTISTNSILINDNTVKMLQDVNGIQLSLEMGKMETTILRGENVWDAVMNAKKILEDNGIEYYFRTSFWEGNLFGLKEFIDMDAPLVLFPRIDKPPLTPKITSKLFEEVLRHDNWILALPNFLQYLGKNGRCKAGSERINICSDGKITPCNFDLDYFLGKIGDNLGSIEKNIDNYLSMNKKVPDECLGCKNVDICRGSCYACNASVGCPLKYNFSLQDFMGKFNVDAVAMQRHVDKVAGFMKKMLVC